MEAPSSSNQRVQPNLQTGLARPDVLYFGYGSNMWLEQMERRCPQSTYVGIAILEGWRWMINERGYANVVPSAEDHVYGLVYKLSEEDEKSLDVYEGVPLDYIKKFMAVKQSGSAPLLNKEFNTLVYVDEIRLHDDLPRTEYIYRMNMAIRDALKEGVPPEYMDKYLRPFIPANA
ncbi:hypothetical protein PC9H_000972 [Pleurotus ostreatus]|uniref:gamma-glutamylcyclotransferase n=1 Tax=Pleurotus ostreatus TaxID=5322 RepID=A0A8H7A602_PLEOS|nr:uncharacterized protein PC9H_000972 [Pleurotus ostreatus]KAF7440626.1 hypothetical protein PC9H_000972 [Pleurotus ostreatus]KAJ8699996.1 hypothetical protein PTI98_003065 [Pleurotus ostreatus]